MRTLHALLLSLAVCLCVRPGAADEPVEAGEAAAERAFNEGVVHYERGDLARARDAFRTARKLNPKHALSVANLGQIESELGQHRAAIEHFDAALRLAEGDAELTADLERRIAKESAYVMTVRIECRWEKRIHPTVVSRFPCDPRQHVALSVDDVVERRDLGVITNLVLEPGDHVIRADLEGHRPISMTARGVAGDRREIHILFELVAPTSPPRKAKRARSEPLWPAWVGLGVGGAAVAVAIVPFAISDPPPSDGALAGGILVGVGGAIMVTAGLYAIGAVATAPKSTPAANAQAPLFVDARGLGLRF